MIKAKPRENERHWRENKSRHRHYTDFWQRGQQISHELHSTRESNTVDVLVHRQDQRRNIFHLPVGKVENNEP